MGRGRRWLDGGMEWKHIIPFAYICTYIKLRTDPSASRGASNFPAQGFKYRANSSHTLYSPSYVYQRSAHPAISLNIYSRRILELISS